MKFDPYRDDADTGYGMLSDDTLLRNYYHKNPDAARATQKAFRAAGMNIPIYTTLIWAVCFAGAVVFASLDSWRFTGVNGVLGNTKELWDKSYFVRDVFALTGLAWLARGWFRPNFSRRKLPLSDTELWGNFFLALLFVVILVFRRGLHAWEWCALIASVFLITSNLLQYRYSRETDMEQARMAVENQSGQQRS